MRKLFGPLDHDPTTPAACRMQCRLLTHNPYCDRQRPDATDLIVTGCSGVHKLDGSSLTEEPKAAKRPKLPPGTTTSSSSSAAAAAAPLRGRTDVQHSRRADRKEELMAAIVDLDGDADDKDNVELIDALCDSDREDDDVVVGVGDGREVDGHDQADQADGDDGRDLDIAQDVYNLINGYDPDGVNVAAEGAAADVGELLLAACGLMPPAAATETTATSSTSAAVPPIPPPPTPLPQSSTLLGVLTRFGLTQSKDSFPFDVDQGTVPIARVHKMWNTTVKAVCKRHRNCSCMLLASWFNNFDAATAVAVEWAVAGTSTSEAVHWAQSKRLIESGKRAAASRRSAGTTAYV